MALDPDEGFEAKAECERRIVDLYATLLRGAKSHVPLNDGLMVILNFELEGRPVIRSQYYKCWPVGFDPRPKR